MAALIEIYNYTSETEYRLIIRNFIGLMENLTGEQRLLNDLRDGKEQAFEQLYQQYSLRIYRKILKMVKLEVLANELMHDVFVKVWIKRAQIDIEKSFRSYLFSIAQNLVYDTYRKLALDDKLAAEVKLISTAAFNYTDEAIYYKETEQLLLQAIDLLPPQQKLIFKACKLDGKSYEEVADELGISTSTINGHIVKATKTVKAYLVKYGSTTLLLAVAIALKDA